jgi:hypothetical protein
VLVSTAALDGPPTAIDRRPVPLVESGVPSQQCHHETLAMPEAEAEALLLRVRRSIRARTEKAFDHLAADLGPTRSVRAITIRQPPRCGRLPVRSSVSSITRRPSSAHHGRRNTATPLRARWLC